MTCQHERYGMRDVKAFRNHEKYAALRPRKQSTSCIKLWLHHNRADGSNPFLQNLFTQRRKCFKLDSYFQLINKEHFYNYHFNQMVTGYLLVKL